MKNKMVRSENCTVTTLAWPKATYFSLEAKEAELKVGVSKGEFDNSIHKDTYFQH